MSLPDNADGLGSLFKIYDSLVFFDTETTGHAQGFRNQMAQPEQTLPAIIQNERRG